MFDIIWYDYSDGDIEKLIVNAKEQSRTEYVWLAHRDLNYNNFNFRWMPNRHQKHYKHAWPSHNNPQHYTTWFIPIDIDKGTVHHDEMVQTSDEKYYDLCLLNTNSFYNPHKVDFQVHLITTMQSAIDTAVKKSTKAWLWIIADCCEYDEFDFNWLPSNHELNYIHCWPSGTCEKGDTFLINVDAYKRGERNYNFNHEPVKRKLWPHIFYKEDNLCDALSQKSNALYTIFSKNEYVENIIDVCLWEKRPVVSLNKSNSTSLIPRDCFVKKEIYEYSYLLKNSFDTEILCDIVFISYDEIDSDTRYKKLLENYPNAKRVHGIEGMENALREAARVSSTDYFFAVFAKTRLYESWDFKFQPDYWRDSRNYIFYAINNSNKLVYGEMGIILYNKNFLLNLTSLNNVDLDITMSFPIQVVPIISVYGEFATDSYRAWRTAFRETCKLNYFNYKKPCIETQYRINRWMSYAEGEYADDVLRGAKDGYEYFDQNKNDIDNLKKTFNWKWLKNYYNLKYS